MRMCIGKGADIPNPLWCSAVARRWGHFKLGADINLRIGGDIERGGAAREKKSNPLILEGVS